ncbi:T9SS type A sorting domain-containing protein [Carboxylicivirga sp. RSCT41]|uniref:T9SS type A sorting domain-containing protein n=1 Tax=Carboxylicivirga agarovorans TaxID=3417570 RepID=UPI003D351C54
MKRFTMFLLATILAIGSMVGQTESLPVIVKDASVTPPVGPSIGIDPTLLGGATVTVTDGVDTWTADTGNDALNDEFGFGIATFNDLPVGTYDITVEMDGYVTQTISFELTSDVSTQGGPTVMLEPVTENMPVIVKDASVTPPIGPSIGIDPTLLGGATVTVTDGVDTWTLETGNDALTDEFGFGIATFNDLRHGTYDITVEMDGYVTQTISFELTSDVSTQGGPTVMLEPVTENMPVIVKDASVTPPIGPSIGIDPTLLGGATVTVTDGVDTWTLETGNDALTDEFGFGIATFNDLRHGTYDITVEMDGYVTQTISFELTSDVSTQGGPTVMLEPVTENMPVIVKDASVTPPIGPSIGIDPTLLGGATVTVTDGVDTWTLETGNDALTDEFGFGIATFNDLRHGTYDITVEMDGYVTQTISFELTSDVSTQGGPTVMLEPVTENMPVIVKDASVTPPIGPSIGIDPTLLGGATVTVTDGVDTWTLETGNDALTDEFGFGIATFNDLRHGTYDITVEMDGYVTQTISFELTSDVSTQGGPTVMLEPVTENMPVIVKDASVTPPIGPSIGIDPTLLGGATVTVTDGVDTWTLETGNDALNDEFGFGIATFNDLRHGTYDITVEMDGFVTQTISFELTSDVSTQGGPTVMLEPVATSVNNQKQNILRIYPNPAVDVINIQSDIAIKSVEVYTIGGVLVKSLTGEHITQLHISDLSKGVYVVKTIDVRGKQLINKINKN